MLITPALVLGTIKAVAEAITETLRFYQTPQGQVVVTQLLADQAKAQGWFTKAGDGIKDFFSGELFKRLASGEKAEKPAV